MLAQHSYIKGGKYYGASCTLACDKMCEMSRRFKYRLDSGSGCPKEARTHFGINVGPFLMVSDFFLASFSKIQGEISHFLKLA